MEHVTLTELVQFKDEAVYVKVHILAQSESDTEPYGWFEDQQNQELLALVYDVILSKAFGDLDSGHSPPIKSKYQIKRSRNLRVLFSFKPLDVKQHIVIPQQLDLYSQITPLAAFVSDEGKKVLPFLSRQTRSGSGYKAYHVLNKCVDVFVDSYPLTDPRGVFKVLARLDPSCHTDLVSYFTQSSSSSFSEPTFDAAATMIVGATLRGDMGEAPIRKRRDYNKGRKTAPKKKCHVPSKRVLKKLTNQQSLHAVVGGGGGGEKSLVVKQDSPSQILECVDLAESEMETFFNFSSSFHDDVVTSHSTVTGVETPLLVPRGACFVGGVSTPSRRCHTMTDNSGQNKGTVEEGQKDCPRNIQSETSLTRSGEPFTDDEPTTSSRIDRITLDEERQKDGPWKIQDDTRSSGDHLKTMAHDGMTVPSGNGQLTLDPETVIARSPQKCIGNVDDLEAGCFAREGSCESDLSQSALPSIPEVIDLTDSSDTIDCDEVCTPHCSQQMPTTELIMSEEKRKKMRSAKELMHAVKSVGELSLNRLRTWLYVSKPVFINIFKGIVSSDRHDKYISGCKKRGTLVHQYDTRLFSKEQVDVITDLLLHIFCGKHMKYFGYIMSVLLPECLIRIIGDIHQISFREAEMMMMDYSDTSGVGSLKDCNS